MFAAAADYDVRIHYAPFHADATKLFRVHGGRVKDIGTSWGVPRVFWSVAEDGLVYQFDVRALPKTDGRGETHDASGVLVRLGRDRRGKLLRGMGMATHPLDPTKFVLACGDYYTRLFDHRMLRIQQLRSRPETSIGATIPVDVFAPPHLHLNTFCDRSTKFKHDEAHGTSIQFNSDGSEILANYHNDHIYLFNVNGGPNPVTKFEKQGNAAPAWANGLHMDESIRPLPIRAHEVKELHSKGLVALLARNHIRALKHFSKACSANSLSALSPSFLKDLFHNCAKAYLGRSWSADYYLATAYCKKALEVGGDDREVELTYIRALHTEKKIEHARFVSKEYASKYPESASDVRRYLHGEAQNNNARRSYAGTPPHQHSDAESDESEDEEVYIDRVSSPSGDQSSGHDDEDEDDDEEESDSGKSDSDNPDESSHSPKTTDHQTEDEFWESSRVHGKEVHCDVVRRYIGYCNTETDIKEAAFFGNNDAFIVAGSDDGRAYIWNKVTGKLVNAIVADETILNCVRPHPFDSCLATSGIEDVIRLWSPIGDPDLAPSEDELDEMTSENQSKMSSNNWSFYFGGADPDVLRVVFQPAGREAVQECATS